ncbi:5120_t:CDS:2 [Funneliformis caledonium]|uniref:5120_t:CDS:1 n=1 Tax=Funneliformis caledonium TaxID=1117310 RepID=A0A9N8ZAR9_9GLOM|nr:5120_t:CDS:2 [Funneliformis caledonium]
MERKQSRTGRRRQRVDYYNGVKKLRDIDPSSINPQKSSRVTLLGDAHPVLGLGTNNAIEDAYFLTQALLNKSSENYISCIQAYEKEC